MPDFPQDEVLRLKSEIEKLRHQNKKLLQALEDKHFKHSFRKYLQIMDTSALIKGVYEREKALHLLLTMTAQIVKAEGVSILLFDRKKEELYFEAAIGEKAEMLKQFRLKPNEGIAGFCFTTGEPIAVSDLMKDPRFKREIAKALGQKQKTLMAAPLIYHQEVIGVMEAVNKIGGDTFSAEDLEILSTIANFSAIFLHKSHLYSDMYSLFMLLLKKVALKEEGEEISLKEFIEISSDIEKIQQVSEDFEEAIEMSTLIYEISQAGTEEVYLVKKILEHLKEYIYRKHHIFDGDSVNWTR